MLYLEWDQTTTLGDHPAVVWSVLRMVGLLYRIPGVMERIQDGWASTLSFWMGLHCESG